MRESRARAAHQGFRARRVDRENSHAAERLVTMPSISTDGKDRRLSVRSPSNMSSQVLNGWKFPEKTVACTIPTQCQADASPIVPDARKSGTRAPEERLSMGLARG